MEKVTISWDKIHNLCEVVKAQLISQELVNKEHFTYFYGVPLGGWVPLAIILNSLRTDGYKVDVVTDLDDIIVLAVDHNDTVVVFDDISDTGDTFNTLGSLWFFHSNIKFGCLFKRREADCDPHIIGETWEGDEWLVFPWEREDADARRDGTIV